MKKTKQGWDLFISYCQHTNSQQELSELLTYFLTPEEVEQIASRALLTDELIKGDKVQRTIAKELEVSIATVTRCSNNLKRINNRLKKFLKNDH